VGAGNHFFFFFFCFCPFLFLVRADGKMWTVFCSTGFSLGGSGCSSSSLPRIPLKMPAIFSVTLLIFILSFPVGFQGTLQV